MKLIIASALIVSTAAFAPAPVAFKTTALNANIRGPTEKSEELRFGWDGSTALGGAVEVAKPSRMLDDIREAGETIPEACELFNANLEMDGDSVMFEDVIAVSILSVSLPYLFIYPFFNMQLMYNYAHTLLFDARFISLVLVPLNKICKKI